MAAPATYEEAMDVDSPAPEPAERLLRASRPLPDLEFKEQLERKLFPQPRMRPARRHAGFRPALAGAAGVAGLAALLGGLGLAGAGPLAPGGSSDTRAGDNCRFVRLERLERVPRVTTNPTGDLEIRFRRERVERLVERCR